MCICAFVGTSVRGISAQSFRGVHIDRICVCLQCARCGLICLCCVLKKKEKLDGWVAGILGAARQAPNTRPLQSRKSIAYESAADWYASVGHWPYFLYPSLLVALHIMYLMKREMGGIFLGISPSCVRRLSTPSPISLTRPRLHVAVTSEQASYHLSAIPSSSNLRTPPATSPCI